MRFANPQILWFLLVFPPALTAFFWWSLRKRQQLIAQFIQARLMPSLTVGISPGRRQLRYGAIALAVICLIIALARPQWGFAWEEVKQRGLDIVVAIDTSKSMLAEDIRPNRLARAKLAAMDLMRLAKADRLGLVAFAGGAFLQCPLTIDDSAFRQSLEALDVNTIPEGGTALAEAIEVAQTAFKAGDNHKILVILTDGEDHDSGAVEAARTAAGHDMEIFTIGVGTPKGELLAIKDAKGRTDYIRDAEGHVVQSKLNEQLLREIAGATQHGFYLPMQGPNTMETLYREGLAPLPKSESAEKLVKRYYERYQWPLGTAMALLLFEMLLPEKRGAARRATVSTGTGATAVIPAKAVTMTIVLAFTFTASASPSSALRSYQSGDYDRSLKEYERLLEKHQEDSRLHFNAGAAAYRDKKYDEAVTQFNESLNSPDLTLQQRAYYNLGNTLFDLGADAPDPNERTKSWEEAVKDFENAVKLNPQDADAKFNHDYVKKRLEELKKQQQKQQNQQNQNQEDKDQQKQDQKKNQQQNQDKKNDQSKQQQQQQNQDKKDQQQQKQEQGKKDEQKQNEEKQQQAKNEQKNQQPKPDQNQQKGEQKKGAEKKDNQQQQQGQTYAAGQMTPREAQQLMDAVKGDEMVMPIKPELKQKPQTGPVKDW
jgi:Ca-activated chloride channel homolog